MLPHLAAVLLQPVERRDGPEGPGRPTPPVGSHAGWALFDLQLGKARARSGAPARSRGPSPPADGAPALALTPPREPAHHCVRTNCHTERGFPSWPASQALASGSHIVSAVVPAQLNSGSGLGAGQRQLLCKWPGGELAINKHIFLALVFSAAGRTFSPLGLLLGPWDGRQIPSSEKPCAAFLDSKIGTKRTAEFKETERNGASEMDSSPRGDTAACQKLVHMSVLLVTGGKFHGHFGAMDVGTRR